MTVADGTRIRGITGDEADEIRRMATKCQISENDEKTAIESVVTQTEEEEKDRGARANLFIHEPNTLHSDAENETTHPRSPTVKDGLTRIYLPEYPLVCIV